MHVISQTFHVWKSAIGMDKSLRVPPALPTIVNDYVPVACIPHAAGDHRIRGRAHFGISDLLRKMVPTVPSHRRCSCHLLCTVVQYATGEAANFYTTALTPEPWIKNATGLRVTNQFLIEPGDPYERFSIFATTAYQRYKSLNTANAVDSWISFGGRPQWYFTNHFNIALEAAADHVIEGSGNYSGWLRKVTFAPEVSAGRGYYSRPAVRLFFTYASWTDGFKGRVGGPAFLNLKQGITAGLQFENWW
jgi:maltoporin